MPTKSKKRWRSKTKEYQAWYHMVHRCYNRHNLAYDRYGGRGIRVCDRWKRSFDAFLQDVGHAPSEKLTIDRIDNDGHYEPGNVRWATRKEQQQNRRYPKGRTMLKIYGVTLSMAAWSRISGTPQATISARYTQDGRSAKQAVFGVLGGFRGRTKK